MSNMTSIRHQFTHPLLAWHKIHGRQHLPWKHPVDAYRIWLSEIMLQQTQVKTVIPYFLKFMERFPNVSALAHASEDEVLSLWSGLGYYSRGRNLHRTAQLIQTQYQGRFPEDLQTLIQLPGIGPSTAAAIASQAFHQPTPILDGNVKRVLSRYFMITGTSTQTTKNLWDRAHQCMSQDRAADYTQAIMDLGATCCTSKKPQCVICPLQKTCQAYLNAVVADFPEKKPKKEIPIKHQQFLLMHNQKGQIYLERRPSKGLWGGLWCTPSIDVDVDPATFIQTAYSHRVLNIEPLMIIKHTFTHFRLYIDALSVETTVPGSCAGRGTRRSLLSDPQSLLSAACPRNPGISPDNNIPGFRGQAAESRLRGAVQSVTMPEHQTGWFSHTETIKLGLAKPISDMIERFYASAI